MSELYVSDYIKSVTVEHTDNYVKVIEDPYVLNQLGCILVAMSQEDEIELKMFLEKESRNVNDETNNDELDFEGDSMSFNNDEADDVVVLLNRVNEGSFLINKQ